MKKILLMAAALSFNALNAQEFSDNENDNQEIEAIGAAENAEKDVGPSDIAAEQEEKQQHDVAQIENSEAEQPNDSEE